MEPLGLYIHIPFCVRKCGYCDFLSFQTDADAHKRYIEALKDEIQGCMDKFGFDTGGYEVNTVYIGGGTPSVIRAEYIEEILDDIRRVFGQCISENAEITLELNPGTVSGEELAVYRRAGINRLSIGLQSADEKELEALGRIHGYADFEQTYTEARRAGFENVNVDIMTAIPCQTMESLRNTIDTVASLDPPPEHISAYSLILEEGTPFYEKYSSMGEKHEDVLPGEDEERAMYHYTVECLENYGYHRYEISNFARPGFESRHNSAYWRRTEYIGFGLGASSFINDTRYRNTADMGKYLERPVSNGLFEEKIRLSTEDKMEEFMFLGLRMSKGISEAEFGECFGVSVRQCYGEELDRLIADALIKIESGRIRLTEKGVDYGNYVFSRFIRN